MTRQILNTIRFFSIECWKREKLEIRTEALRQTKVSKSSVMAFSSLEMTKSMSKCSIRSKNPTSSTSRLWSSRCMKTLKMYANVQCASISSSSCLDRKSETNWISLNGMLTQIQNSISIWAKTLDASWKSLTITPQQSIREEILTTMESSLMKIEKACLTKS